jgi:oxygen-dependent protoporphyrinogen oxidase
MFVAPRDGMSALVAAIAAKLPSGAARLNAPVERIAREGNRWRLAIRDGETLACDGLILAAPAPQSARLLADVDKKLAAELAGIEHAGSAVVALGYRREQIMRPVEGFGFVAPAVEGRRILAGSFASEKFPGRAPDGRVLIRVFLGGALRPDLAGLPEGELFTIAREELDELIGAQGEPELALATRWPATMPQYHVGHLDRVARIESRVARLPALALAGNALRGVGVPQCVRAGETAAAAVVETLGKPTEKNAE